MLSFKLYMNQLDAAQSSQWQNTMARKNNSKEDHYAFFHLSVWHFVHTKHCTAKYFIILLRHSVIPSDILNNKNLIFLENIYYSNCLITHII